MAYDVSTVLMGKDCKLFVNEFDISGWTNSFKSTDAIKAVDAPVWGASEQSKPGQRSLTLSIGALYDQGHDALGATITDSARAAIVAAGGLADSAPIETFRVIFLPGLTTVGARALHAMGFVQGNAQDIGAQTINRMDTKVQPSGVFACNANVLHYGEEDETGEGTTFDATAARIATLGGSIGHLSVHAWSGLTSLVVRVQDSINGTDWTTLDTFTTATGVTSERKVTTAAVKRYRKADWTIVGTGTCSFVLTFGELPEPA